MKNFNIIGTFSSILGIVFTAFVVENKYLKIIISLAILIVVLSIMILQQYFLNRKINKKYQELNKRHKALTGQYKLKDNENKSKDEKIYKYEFYWLSLNTIFINTTQDSQKDRFDGAYRLYREYTNDLFNNNYFKED